MATGTRSKSNYFKIKRNNSSTSSVNSSAPSPDNKKIKEIVEDYSIIQELAESQETIMSDANIIEQITKDIESKLDTFFENIKGKLKEEVKGVFEDLMKRLQGLEQKVEHLDKENIELKRKLVHMEQYGRRPNIRIFGVKEEPRENCKARVAELLQTKLKLDITEEDMDAAHRVPQRAKDRPKPIIVRFFKRDDKEKVMRNRKQLKNTGISVAEDLCSEMLQLYNRVKNDTLRVQDCWVWRGEIFFKDHKGEIHKVRYGEPLQSLDVPVMRFNP